ncbi:MAG: hypothetical protein U0869_07925 [Chloroflexota bacterium]
MRGPGVLVAVVGLVAVLSSAPVAAQSPGPVPKPEEPPLCSEVPQIQVPDDRFGAEPVYVGGDQPTGALRRWARRQPGFQDMWIDWDHRGWVVLAFSRGAAARQAALEKAFPGVGAVAIDVDWSKKALDRVQQRAIHMSDLVQVTATDILKGVVLVGIGALEPDKVARAKRIFAGQPVCIDGMDPATLPPAGPQPQGGDGWRLLADAQVGPSYRTGIAADQAAYEDLWAIAGMSGPLPAVDFAREVAIWFGAVYGISCPEIRLDAVDVDLAAALVSSRIVQTGDHQFCTMDANGHAYLVALDRDRLPAPPFRIQLSAEDPPKGAVEETTHVDADLRVPGSVPAPGQVRFVAPSWLPDVVTTGGIIEPGVAGAVVVDARCGLEWLGRFNHAWWRTEVPADATAWLPEAWRSSVGAADWIKLGVLIRTTDDPANPDGLPRAEVTLNGETVVYHPTDAVRPYCPPRD